MEDVGSSRELAWIRARLAKPLPVSPEVAVIATTLNGQVAYWNDGAERLYGWPQEEAFQQNILRLTPARYALNQAAQIMSTLQTGQPWSGQILLGRKDRSPILAFVLDVPVGDIGAGQGAIVGFSVRATQRAAVEDRADTISTSVTRRFAAAA